MTLQEGTSLSFSSHPQGLPSAKFKLSISATKLIQWKMKIAVHMYFEERQHYCPAMSEFKRLQNPLNSIGDTAVHADRTKCHKQKQFRRVTVQRALQWLAHRHPKLTTRSI